jgi:hypothetical protein
MLGAAMLDTRTMLEQHQGVFLDQGCLFVSTTGRLLTGYVNCEVIYPHYLVTNDLVEQLVAPFLNEVEGFICPATGDIVLAQYATMIANKAGRSTTAVWADKGPDKSYRVERNGFEDAIRHRKVLLLNDRISQGRTTLKLVAEARRLECQILGVATLAGVTAATPQQFDVPRVHALSTIDVQSFVPEELPSELSRLPIAIDQALGHGAEFRDEHPSYQGGFIELLH